MGRGREGGRERRESVWERGREKERRETGGGEGWG